MKKKYLTLQDLAIFCEQNNFTEFHSSNDEEVIVVQSPGTFTVDKESIDGLVPVTLNACHDLKNLNGSFISKENMEAALPSFQIKPILANFVKKDDGTIDFGAHDMEIIVNPFDPDEEIINYKERSVGVIYGESSLVFDDLAEVDRVKVSGYLYEDYGNLAIKILEARGGTASVSVELVIKSLSYDVTNKVLNILDFYFNGVTLLGENVKPGMAGSDITLEDFNKENNSLFDYKIQKKMFDQLDEIKNILSSFNINKNEEGGTKSVKLNELLEKYSISMEDLNFEVEGLSDEELEQKFEEEFDETDEDTEDTSSENVNLEVTEEEACKRKKKKYELNKDGSATLVFEISHEDIRVALYNLLYKIEENDDEYYYINAVYDDYFIYSSWDESKIYKHAYSVEGDNVSLADERTQLFKEYLTTSEKATLDEMRANYETLENKVNNYEKKESREAKNKILSQEVYSALIDTDGFKELKSKIDEYTVEEIQDKVDLLLAHCIKKGEFSFNGTNNTIKLSLKDEEKEKKPYGTLFK